jgi:type I restriction enzyme, S subunit
MEVNEGFRITDVGTLPVDWAVSPISCINPFVTSGSRGWARFYADTGVPFIRITNLSRESIYLDVADLKFVNLPLGDREGRRTQLQLGDLLVSITADIGMIGYFNHLVPQPAYINQHIALVRCDPSVTDTKFLAYFLASANPQRAFRAVTDQGAKAGMNLAGVLRIYAAFPPLPEQRAIATALSDVDALLDGLDRLIAKKRDLKQAAMQQLLAGQTRLPGFDGEWEVVEFGEVVSIRNLKVIASSTPPGTQCVELESLGQGSGRLLGSTTSTGASSKYSFQKGDVLFGRLRAYLRKYWLATFAGVCSTALVSKLA